MALPRNTVTVLSGLMLFNFGILASYMMWARRLIPHTERTGVMTLANISNVTTEMMVVETTVGETELKYDVSFECPDETGSLKGKVTVDVEGATKKYVQMSDLVKAGHKGSSNSSDDILGDVIVNGVNDSRISAIFGPDNCKPKHSVAIIIPFRYRETHLRILLGHLLPILQRQLLRFGVFVVEEQGNGVFNKGRLMNTGFKYAKEAAEEANITFDCFVFHDVDLLVEYDTLRYRCHQDAVNHLSVSIDKFQYKPVCCGMTVGGVLALTGDQYQSVNGYPNMYWGWGGEDDDMNARIKHKGLQVSRMMGETGRFTMIKHEADKGNKWNPAVGNLLKSAGTRFSTDGLNNLDTKIVFSERYPLFTKIMVDVGEKPK